VNARSLLGVTALTWLFTVACQDDGPVLYMLGQGGDGGSDAGGGQGQGASQGTAGGEPMQLSCQPKGKDAPCYCPAQSSCHCEGSLMQKEPLCHVDCPDGGCDVTCDGNCDLWCGKGCTFECPAQASCYIKCGGDCSVLCNDKSVCKISSYTSVSNIICQGNAQCTCLEGSLCECEGDGCITDGK